MPSPLFAGAPTPTRPPLTRQKDTPLRHLEPATCRFLTSLIRSNSNRGSLSEARKVFDEMPHRDVVSWTAILTAYVQCDGSTQEMIHLFHRMLRSGVAPNRHTVTVLLKRATLRQGKQLHGFSIKNGWGFDEFVGSCLIDFYARNRILDDAKLVFDRIQHRDLVCYNTMLMNYGRTGPIDGFVLLFNEMGFNNLVPNESTLVALLNGCANFGFIGPSKQFHAQSVIRGFGSNETIQGVIVDMYAKCGDVEAARKIFDGMSPTTSVVAWNSIIGGYGKNGFVEESLRLFDLMILASVSPDHITYTLLLSACSHSGFVNKGLELFAMMTQVYRIHAHDEHYCCMVDLLGRAGMIKEAYEFIKRNGLEHELGASVWSSLLASCRACGDVEVGGIAAKRLFDIEHESSSTYVMLSAIFAKREQWGDVVKMRRLMEQNGAKKEAGCSWIEVGGLVHEFKAGKRVECGIMGEVYCSCESLYSSIKDSQIVDDSVCCNLQEYCS